MFLQILARDIFYVLNQPTIWAPLSKFWDV